MNFDNFYNRLLNNRVGSDFDLSKAEPNFSIFFELRILLYVSVSLFTAGIGWLLYVNMSYPLQIILLIFLTLIIIVGYYFCFSRWTGFDKNQLASESIKDYVHLGSSILLGSWVGYIQFLFQIVPELQISWLILPPTIVYFITAYLFDHKGVLNMAIVGVCSFEGIKLSLLGFDSLHTTPFVSGLVLGILCCCFAWISVSQKIKAHFGDMYLFWGVQLLFSSLLFGMFSISDFIVLGLIALAAFCYFYAKKTISYFYWVMSVLYAYIASSFIISRIFLVGDNWLLLWFYYSISLIGVVLILYKSKNILGAKLD